MRAEEPGGQEVEAQVGVGGVGRRRSEVGHDGDEGDDADATKLVGPDGCD